MKLTNEQLRDIAERDIMEPKDFMLIEHTARLGQQDYKDFDILKLCEELNQSRIVFPRLLAHIKAVEEENSAKDALIAKYGTGIIIALNVFFEDFIAHRTKKNGKGKKPNPKPSAVPSFALYDDNNPIEPDIAYKMRDILRNALE